VEDVEITMQSLNFHYANSNFRDFMRGDYSAKNVRPPRGGAGGLGLDKGFFGDGGTLILYAA
jgi:hypothetical protein